MTNSTEHVTVLQASELLGVCKVRVLQFIAAGRLSVTRSGRRFILLRADVLAFKKMKRPVGRPTGWRKPKGGD